MARALSTSMCGYFAELLGVSRADKFKQASHLQSRIKATFMNTNLHNSLRTTDSPDSANGTNSLEGDFGVFRRTAPPVALCRGLCSPGISTFGVEDDTGGV